MYEVSVGDSYFPISTVIPGKRCLACGHEWRSTLPGYSKEILNWKKIVLIDGEQLSEMMMDHEVSGVQLKIRM